jgi:hypothetical protein
MAIAVLLLAASPALAAQRFASPTGSGSTCSQASPCPIQIAVNNAGMGDEVIVAPGDYSPPASVTPGFSNIYVHGVYGQPMPRIHFTAGFLWIGNPGDRASWLAVDSTSSAPLETTNGGSADQVIAHSTGSAAQACYVYATLIDSVCWVSGAGSIGIEAQTGLMTTITLRNVTAVATGSGGIGVRIQADSSGVVAANLTNVIARGASSDITLNKVSGGTLTANIDHSNHGPINNSGATVNETNQQTAAPLFVNAAAGDFNEIPGSPTINAGVTSPANGAFDYLGRPRVIGGATDIGAAEYDPFNGVILGTRKAKVKKHKAPLKITCPAGTPPPCAGSLTLRYRHGSKTSVAGKASFSIDAGATAKLKVKLKKPAFGRLDDRGKLKVTASADATDGAGTSAGTSGKVKLKA